MDTTDRAPNVPLAKFKRTKILATLGPATNTYEAILALIQTGTNGIRLNFSHDTYEAREQQIKWIRKASKEYGKPVSIVQDLQGPKMRLGEFEGIATVQKSQTIRFAYNVDYETTGIVPTQYDLSKKVKRGERMLIFDGSVRFIISSVRDGVVSATAENDGILIRRKGINLPDTDFAGDIITKKDREDMAFGTTHDIDYVALSFIQSAKDVRSCRAILKNLGSQARVIAKIETRAAVDDLEAIVEEADAVMVARGDLAVETSPESVPVVQRQIIALGLRYAKPTIVATQMLASMVESDEPTRAEVSDIATAVILGTDCLMLSDETAVGKHPIKTVEVMKRVIGFTQTSQLNDVEFIDPDDMHASRAMSAAVINLAENMHAKAIVAETKSGATARQIVSHRPGISVIAVTNDDRTAQQLAIVYGIKSYVRPADKRAATKLTNWLQQHKVLKKGDIIVTASGQYPGVVGTTDTIKVRVL